MYVVQQRRLCVFRPFRTKPVLLVPTGCSLFFIFLPPPPPSPPSPPSPLQGTSTGELVTLMSNDAQRLPDMSLSVHAIWSTPLFIAIAIFLLVRLVGAAAGAGLVFLVAMIPLQGILAAKQMGLQRAQMKQTESRIKVINEVLQVRCGAAVVACWFACGGGRVVFVLCVCFLN